MSKEEQEALEVFGALGGLAWYVTPLPQAFIYDPGIPGTVLYAPTAYRYGPYAVVRRTTIASKQKQKSSWEIWMQMPTRRDWSRIAHGLRLTGAKKIVEQAAALLRPEQLR